MSLSKWPPGGHIGFFGFHTLTLLWPWISTPKVTQYLYIWVGAYWFSETSLSKWLPGGHIGYFGFRALTLVWLWIVWLWNFSFKFHVHVLWGCRQKPNDRHLCRFQMASLWFWTMFNCDPPIAHCYPLLWGGGILVDHWSTIFSLTW